MKGLIITGILFIVLGIASLTYGGITYTTEETVLDIGPLEAEVENKETIPLSPVLGVVSLLAGSAMLIYGKKSS